MSEDLEPKKSESPKPPDVALAETKLDGVVGGTAAQVATTPTNAEGAGAGKVADPWAILK
jgi:hypothetical protein